MILENYGVVSKTTTKEKVKSLALKTKVTKEQTSGDSDNQDGNDEDVDEEKEAEAFNLLARNFRKFFCKGNRFKCENRFGNGVNKIEGHFASECRKPKENKDFIGETWSDIAEVPSASALQVLRRLGSIFTSVYVAKLKRVVSLLKGLQGRKKIALCQKE
ncbi:hypothetical protein Tco_0595141 [Tanacetum coccineum]